MQDPWGSFSPAGSRASVCSWGALQCSTFHPQAMNWKGQRENFSKFRAQPVAGQHEDWGHQQPMGLRVSTGCPQAERFKWSQSDLNGVEGEKSLCPEGAKMVLRIRLGGMWKVPVPALLDPVCPYHLLTSVSLMLRSPQAMSSRSKTLHLGSAQAPQVNTCLSGSLQHMSFSIICRMQFTS